MRPFTTITAFILLFNVAASSSSQPAFNPAALKKPLSRQEYQKKEKEWEDCLEDCKKKNANKASYVHNDFAQCFTDCKHLDPRPGTPRAKGLHSSVNSGRKYM